MQLDNQDVHRPRRPTMVDVARQARVSIKTVSRVINGEPTVSDELAERVLTAAANLNFRRNDVARTLRSSDMGRTIGLLIEEFANPFYSAIASMVADIAEANDTLLIIASSEENPDRERRLLLGLCQRRVSGLLVVPAGDDHSYLRSEVQMGIPAVFLDRPPGQLLADTVVVDNRGGAQTGLQRLLDDGHRRIGILLDSLSVFTMRERLAGAQAALAAAGVRYDERLVRHDVRTPDDAARTVTHMLAYADPPTAFFCANNRITVGAVHALYQLGNDAGLVGFDDFELAHLMPRPLQVIAYDPTELARIAAEQLFLRIAGDQSWPITRTLTTQLLDRGLRQCDNVVPTNA